MLEKIWCGRCQDHTEHTEDGDCHYCSEELSFRLKQEYEITSLRAENKKLKEQLAVEREACALLCEETTAAWSEWQYNEACMDCAKAIRLRGASPAL